MISAVQAIVLVLIGLFGRKLPHTGAFLTHLPLVEIVLAIGILAVVSMTLGLLISAMVNSSDKTMPLLVVGVMFQVILTGGIFPVAGKAGLEQISWLSPSRWGFAAVASTVNLNVIQQPPGVKAAGPPVAPRSSAAGPAGISAIGTSAAGATRPLAAGSPTSSPTSSPARGAEPTVQALPTDPLWRHNAGRLAEEHHPDAGARAGVHADHLVADRQDQAGPPPPAAGTALTMLGPGVTGARRR